MGLRIGGETGSVTFGGLSSGLPTNEIIDQILELERRPITLLENQKADFEEKLSILQDLNSKTLSFRNILRNLDNMTNVRLSSDASASEEFSRLTASSSSSSILTATAGTGAVVGSISVRVDRLALAEREVSQADAYANLTDTVGTGNFRITVGSDAAVDITVDSSNNSLQNFVSAINDSDADVRAYILNDGDATNPYRLVIEADDANEAIDVATGTTLTGGTATPTFSETQAATDAQITLDPDGASPVTINSSSNSINDVIKGVTFDLLKADVGTTVTVTVDEDIDEMVTAIQDMIDAYNEINDLINAQAQIDPTTNRGGVLIGDSTLLGLKRQLSEVIASQIGSGNIVAATQIGIDLNDNGQLTVNEEELRGDLAASFSDIRSFFTGNDGFADKLRDIADTYVDPVDGLIVERIKGTNKTISNLAQDILDAEDRLTGIEENLILEFSNLERILSETQQQGLFLTQFLLASQG